MAASSELTDLIVELLEDFGPVTVRRMFGEAGLFRNGLMFALIADDVLFFKSDSENMANFTAEDLPPFTFNTKNGQKAVMSYHRAPERVLDDADEMLTWAQSSFNAALRADAAKPASKRKFKD